MLYDDVSHVTRGAVVMMMIHTGIQYPSLDDIKRLLILKKHHSAGKIVKSSQVKSSSGATRVCFYLQASKDQHQTVDNVV